MLISDSYRALNAEKHASSATFGTSGAKWAATVENLTRKLGAPAKIVTVLDYGCGQGTLRQALWAERRSDFYLYEYDPAIPGKDHAPAPVDLVVCTDVLEHIEPECLDDVLDDLKRLTKTLAFLVVATRPAVKCLPDGRNAHLIVEPARWWMPKLLERWEMKTFVDKGGEFTFVGERIPA